MESKIVEVFYHTDDGKDRTFSFEVTDDNQGNIERSVVERLYEELGLDIDQSYPLILDWRKRH